MKNRFLLIALGIFLGTLTAGCQQMTPVPVVTAPPVTSSAFVQLNAGTNNGGPVTATTYTDQPATGSSCYFVQELDGAGVSAASNTTCNTTTSSLKHIQLSWTVAPGYTCQNAPCTFVVSRAAAVLTPVGVPTMQAPTTTASEIYTQPANLGIQLRAIASK